MKRTKQYFLAIAHGFEYNVKCNRLIYIFHIFLLLFSFIIFYLRYETNVSITFSYFKKSLLLVIGLLALNGIILYILRVFIDYFLQQSGGYDQYDEPVANQELADKLISRQYRMTVFGTLSQLFLVFFIFFLFPTTLIDTTKIEVNKYVRQAKFNRNLLIDAQKKFGDEWQERLMDLREQYIQQHGLDRYNQLFGYKLAPVEQLDEEEQKIQALLEYQRQLEEDKQKVIDDNKKESRRYNSIFTEEPKPGSEE